MEKMAGITAETGTIQTLDEISGVVDESEIRAIFSTQCIKVKTALIYKLKKKVNQSKETCHIINNANMKLRFEISRSQKALQCMLKTQETVTAANIELEKECLVAKHKKMVVTERVAAGERKYEELWLDSKAKYESVPFVKKYLKVKQQFSSLEVKIAELDQKEKGLRDEIKNKTISCSNSDRKRVIECADYVVNQMPKTINYIKEKSAAVDKIKCEIEKIEQERIKKAAQEAEKQKLQKQAQEKMDEDDWFLKLANIQLDLDFEDTFKVKLDKVDKTLHGFDNNSNSTTSKAEEKTAKNVDEEDYSPYFNKPSVFNENKAENFAMRKLVNIIEDINIDKSSAQSIINKVIPENLHPVDTISVNDLKNKKPIEDEGNQDVDIAPANSDNLLPPTPFLDLTLTVSEEKQKDEELMPISQQHKDTPAPSQALKNSQEGFYRKRVSFELPDKLGSNDIMNVDMPEKLEKADPNETIDSQMNLSNITDDGLGKIKDILLKKHHLDLSPQFVYAKNVITSMNLQKKEDGTVTSKFFQQENAPPADAMKTIEKDNGVELTAVKNTEMQPEAQKDANANPTSQNMSGVVQTIQTVSGYSMLQHGTQIITESLDASMMSHMDYEDSDANFPHCLDSSLLLSPKADYTIPETSEKPEKLSSEAPNFFLGLRKIGGGFFGSSPSEAKTDFGAQNQQGGGFSFNFGGEEKKTRGGLFNMFQ